MSDVLTVAPTAAATLPSGLSFGPEDIVQLLSAMDDVRGRLSVLTAADRIATTPRELSVQLRVIARQVLDWSVFLIGEDLAAACERAAGQLQRPGEHDDVRQELAARIIERLRNLAEGSIDNLEGYAFLSGQRLLAAWRRRESRKKPLSSIPGGEESLAENPDEPGRHPVLDLDSFCDYLDGKPQPNPALRMSQVVRSFGEGPRTKAQVAQQLGVSESELTKHLRAIREYRKLWQGEV
jgi:DNA-directed RNA polymerase specialized sigma24 family protein